jgi:hypothetical protein
MDKSICNQIGASWDFDTFSVFCEACDMNNKNGNNIVEESNISADESSVASTSSIASDIFDCNI